MPRFVLALCLLSLWTAPSLAQSTPPPRQLTVVFESGLGDGAEVWRQTVRALGRQTPTFTYDRPGYGRAALNHSPRDPCAIAADLHARLKAANVPPPYVLVGHSLGGQYAYAFSRLYPEDTAGLVLVDATAPGHWQALRERMPAAAGMLQTMRSIAFSPAMRREFDAQDQCLADLPRTPLTIPVRVLTKTRGDAVGGDALLALDRDLAEVWLAWTGATRIEPIANASHYIQRDQPRRLAEVIRQTMAAATR